MNLRKTTNKETTITTVSIDKNLLEIARLRAAQLGRSLSSHVEFLLKVDLGVIDKDPAPPHN